MKTRIAQILGISAAVIERVIALFEEGATIPFIARYRKEQTGGLDEVKIQEIQTAWEQQIEIEKRQITILKAIESQGKLSPELDEKIRQTFDLLLLEDIYLPYKQRRQTRAAKARAKGLEPLAELIWEQSEPDILKAANGFLNEQVANIHEALAGAKDIIAERVNEHEEARSIARAYYTRYTNLVVVPNKEKKDEDEENNNASRKPQDFSKYKDYLDFQKPLSKVLPHQLLAILRAEQEGAFRFTAEPDAEPLILALENQFIRKNCPAQAREHWQEAIADAYKRLLAPSMSTEFLNAAKEKADAYSINVFAENLRQLLLASPLGNKRVLALDPGYASGCKLVVLSNMGDLLENTIIYPTPPRSQILESTQTLQRLVSKYNIEAIAIGNGTAGRETEKFVRSLRFNTPEQPAIFLVNENGASIYSASDVARKEFPNEDITVRGAVSIGRRLIDPLAELVKIDPKSIGVGQYQHDVNQSLLQQKLKWVVESCVNSVGIDLNTASEYLLTHVSGLGFSLANNIVEYRRVNGAFRNRKELLKVGRLGEKAFEQAAGFLRIRNAENPLDNTAVHPEAYPIVAQMAKDMGADIQTLIQRPELRKNIQLEKYATDKIGLPTLKDILQELEKPGRDPRAALSKFEFANIETIKDVYEGMSLPGIVRNMTAFGVFVDIGIKENGLIHISKLSNRRINDPSEVVKVGQELDVTVIGIDLERGRIQLSLIG
jgi:protein Tex